jgi:hypothetical protein
MTSPTFSQLKKTFLDSGFEIRNFSRHRLEKLSLDAPYQVKRHQKSNIMGLIIPDEMIIGLANDLSEDEKATTLIHELIHLYDENMEENEVENLTFDVENSLTPSQSGFLQFLIS